MQTKLSFAPPINERLIISLFDDTGNWAKPYIDAGYPVMLWDKKHEGDIRDMRELELWIDGNEEYIYGVLAAPPCTHFAGSGAPWWAKKDAQPGLMDEAIDLVTMGMFMVELAKAYGGLKFWALENPVGRLEKCVPDLAPYRAMSFQPCEFGDPYTKRTVLWGEFNTQLPRTPVLPLYGSLMNKLPDNKDRQRIRSITPTGFANAFFQANQ